MSTFERIRRPTTKKNSNQQNMYIHKVDGSKKLVAHAHVMYGSIRDCDSSSNGIRIQAGILHAEEWKLRLVRCADRDVF